MKIVPPWPMMRVRLLQPPNNTIQRLPRPREQIPRTLPKKPHSRLHIIITPWMLEGRLEIEVPLHLEYADLVLLLMAMMPPYVTEEVVIVARKDMIKEGLGERCAVRSV